MELDEQPPTDKSNLGGKQNAAEKARQSHANATKSRPVIRNSRVLPVFLRCVVFLHCGM